MLPIEEWPEQRRWDPFGRGRTSPRDRDAARQRPACRPSPALPGSTPTIVRRGGRGSRRTTGLPAERGS